MSRLYLITGFLGAGKTTFLKQFMKQFSSERMHIIVNEFGKEGIDGELLSELGIALDEINNGSIFCSCRLDKFDNVLQQVLQEKPDVIIVEASGLSDPTNVKKILNQREKFPGLEYMGCVCLLDARQFPKVYETAVVVKKQIQVSDLLLLNKKDLVKTEEIEQIQKILKAHRPDLPLHMTSYGMMEERWLQEMQKPNLETEEQLLQTADVTLRKYLLHIQEEIKLETLSHFLNMLLVDTFRIKGFVYLEDTWYLVNAVGNMLYIEPCSEKKETQKNILVILSGYGLPTKKAIRKAMEWYPEVVLKIE